MFQNYKITNIFKKLLILNWSRDPNKKVQNAFQCQKLQIFFRNYAEILSYLLFQHFCGLDPYLILIITGLFNFFYL